MVGLKLDFTEFEIFLRYDLKLDMSGKNTSCYRGRFRDIYDFFSDKELNRDNVNRFFAHLQSRNLRNNTLNNYLKVLKHICKYKNEHFLDDYTYFKKQAYHIEVLTPKEIKDLAEVKLEYYYEIKNTNYLFRTIIYFLALTGLRVSELQNLKWDDLLSDRIIIRDSKTDTSRQVPITEWLYNMVIKLPQDQEYIFGRRGGKLDPKCLNADLKERAKAIHLHKRVYVHVFRHSLCTQLLKDGFPIEKVAMILGHKNITTTNQYYQHLTIEVLYDIIKQHPLVAQKASFEDIKAQVRKLSDMLRRTNYPLKLVEKDTIIMLEIKRG